MALKSIKTPSGWIKPIIPCDGVEQYLIMYLRRQMTHHRTVGTASQTCTVEKTVHPSLHGICANVPRTLNHFTESDIRHGNNTGTLKKANSFCQLYFGNKISSVEFLIPISLRNNTGPIPHLLLGRLCLAKAACQPALIPAVLHAFAPIGIPAPPPAPLCTSGVCAGWSRCRRAG